MKNRRYMKKNLFLTNISIVILFLNGLCAFGQEEKVTPDSTVNFIDRTTATYLLDEGRELYQYGAMRMALRKFREAYVRDKYNEKVAYWIGLTHYAMNNFGYALEYAKIARELSKNTKGETYLLLGESYHRIAKLDSAEINYKKAIEELSNTKERIFEVERKLEEVKKAKALNIENVFTRRKLMDLNINSGYDDYGTVFSSDGKTLYFISRRPDTQGGNVNSDDQRYFEDIYFSTLEKNKETWSKASNDIGRLNSDGFDGVSDISKDGSTIYITLNTSDLDERGTTQSSDIYFSKKATDGSWMAPKRIDGRSINTSFYDGNPTLTADGKKMYFVSGREGDKTRSDIYVAESRDGVFWGQVEKLPEIINSEGNETTPFITPDGKYLFFSSDARDGIGGYDVYVSKKIGQTWSEPVNLGPSINSVNDDLFFKYYPELMKAFVSAYRIQGNKAGLDIFEVNISGWKIPEKK
jgi:Tol biopolymer transport system component